MRVWTWDKDVGHKLFNFHEGYTVLPVGKPIVGSCKTTCIKPIGVISRAKKGDIKIQKAREVHSLPLKSDGNSQRAHKEAEKRKLLNLVYH